MTNQLKKSIETRKKEIIEDRLANPDSEIAFQEFKYITDLSKITGSDRDIHINGVVDGRLRENIYAVNSLIESSLNTIRIYTDNIADSIYGRTGVMYNLEDWLLLDPERKIKALLKNGGDIKKTEFFNYLKRKYKDQVFINHCTIPNISKCKKNVAIFDKNKFKIKYYEDVTNKENILVNFNAPKESELLAEQFDRVFNTLSTSIDDDVSIGDASIDDASIDDASIDDASIDVSIAVVTEKSKDRGVRHFPYYD